MSHAIAHRGPDGEGFLLAGKTADIFLGDAFSPMKKSTHYVPEKKISQATGEYSLALAHRRLSILDVSENGHQPMCDKEENIWITFNGEIYNYIEIKKELEAKGHRFISRSDTEVVIHAYKEWGNDCVKKFNGMWSFCIYDRDKQMIFASRDRFGVKPFYYFEDESYFVFASEQKAFIKGGIIKAEADATAIHDYLVNGRLEMTKKNFFKGIKELMPGMNLEIHLNSGKIFFEKYFSLNVHFNNEHKSDEELIAMIREKLIHSVLLRMRSDVEVGTCLSGGIDSSVIALLMQLTGGKNIHCFTSVFRGTSINEERFADAVAAKIQATHKKSEPDREGFMKELDDLVYSQDVPIWDTSTYAQYKVMQLAKLSGIKVVLDGQGADELFGGYHHHFVAKWNNFFAKGRRMEAIRDMRNSTITIPHPIFFYAKEKIKAGINFSLKTKKKFLSRDFVESGEVHNPAIYFNSVNEQLKFDIEHARLKSFLKCEDRCGMWHSVESRTPFSDDIELIELMFSFSGERKIKKGVAKYFLREAMKAELPDEIYQRYDKKGFETPMLSWTFAMKERMTEEIGNAGFDFLKKDAVQDFNGSDLNEMKLFFKLFILSRWKKVFSA